MDFSKVTSLTIPEGVVTQIADAAGNVLWSAVKPVTITLKNYDQYNYGRITYNGVQQTATFTANIGDTIEITRIDVAINDPNATPSRTGYQMINESTSYTVVSDAIFEGKSKFSGNTSTGMYYLLSITEIPQGHALVNITGFGNANGCYITIDGALYTYATTIAVPIGTTISCIANMNDSDKFGYVNVNGSAVAEYGEGYVYTVIGDVTIYMYWNKGGGYIEITET